MTVIYRHYRLGQCQAVRKQVGNELKTWDVHLYHCGKKAAFYVYFNQGRLIACKKHAEMWKERFQARTRKIN